jgi:hypothetical protein
LSTFPCNTFIIHNGECYLGDVFGDHTLIQASAGSGGSVAVFSDLGGLNYHLFTLHVAYFHILTASP